MADSPYQDRVIYACYLYVLMDFMVSSRYKLVHIHAVWVQDTKHTILGQTEHSGTVPTSLKKINNKQMNIYQITVALHISRALHNQQSMK